MTGIAATTKKIRPKTTVILVLLVSGLSAYWYFDLGSLLTLDALRSSREQLQGYYHDRPLVAALLYLLIYITVAALSLPGATVLTLAGGAIFGFWAGLVLVSFASSLGALLALLVARYLLHDSVQGRFGKQLKPINQGIERDGSLYLLSLRLVPVFPFFMINLVAGLTPIRASTFYWVSQVGMLPGTAVYVNAGTQLASIERLDDILSAPLLLSFALLGLFPLLAKALVAQLRRRKVYRGWTKPRRFDRNLVVIGAGAGGLVSAYIASAVKAGVTLVEEHRMGGDCLNYGCVPSKTLIRAARAKREIDTAGDFGIECAAASVDFARVMARIREVIRAIEPHDCAERYTELGVDVVQGHARIVSPWAVEIATGTGVTTLTTRNIVIATGARPSMPTIPGIEHVNCLTSDTVWDIDQCPKRLLVLGGGPIGCELAQAFGRLGSQVTLLEMAPRLLINEDGEVGDVIASALTEEGVKILTSHEAVAFYREEGGNKALVRRGDGEVFVEFDTLLCAVGRSPRTQGFGLEDLGIPLAEGKTIKTDAFLRTNYPNIYAVGDVAGPYQLTHVAAHQAWYAAINALFGRFKKFKVDYSVIPRSVFTDPEVARAGLSEREAAERDIAFDVTRYDLSELDRAMTDGTSRGFVKVLTVPGKDRILGVTIVGSQAGELIAEYVLAMKHSIGLNKILATIHAYPTLAEANKYAAGQWKRANAPKKLLKLVERFHRWERS